MLALDLIFGNPLKPDILGMVAGHLYYFLTVLHPLAGGKFKFNTPLLVYPFLLYISACNGHSAMIKSNCSHLFFVHTYYHIPFQNVTMKI